MLRKKAQLASLGEWTHINTLERTGREYVKDEILGSLLHKFDPIEEEQVAVKPSSKSRIQSILDAADIENISAMDLDAESKNPGLSVHDVPGGTISFLFEKLSTTMAEEVEAAIAAEE